MSEPSGKSFRFKQFTVFGGQAGMPVSTDGVLLGAWANYSHARQLLDIGTGTGLLALMAAQRFPDLAITALDIEPSACLAAAHNFELSPWSSRITLLEQDLLSWQSRQPFDAIVCNPPYFNSGVPSQIPQRATARHSQQLSHNNLLADCYTRLANTGSASFILPLVEGERFIAQAVATDWSLTRLCRVAPSTKKPVNRLLIELAKRPGLQAGIQATAQATPTIESALVINKQHRYSPEFIALTKAFYLKH